MGFGKKVDAVAGALSRLVHLRAARHNTVADLERHYLGLTAEEMFPPPPPITEMRVRRSLADRVVHTSTLSWQSGHTVLCPRYQQRHEGEYKRNLTAWARWIRPDGHRRPACLIYVHGWLEPGSWIEEATLFQKWTRDLGIDVVHVSLPFHGRRNPRGALFSGEYFWTADLVRSVEGVRQAIYDVRACMSWLRTKGYDQVGVSGISLGGSLTMILACVEPTPDYVVPIVAHLELEDAVEEAPILWRMKRDLERWGIDRARRRSLFTRLGISQYLPVLRPDRQLWIEAREDLYINPELVKRQWRDWGRPPIHWIEGGHMTFPLHAGEFTQRMGELLGELPPA